MKIAVVGKGGSGKTSIAGSLARILSRSGVDGLLAIDGDSNPNLALTLGIPASRMPELSPMPRSVLDRGTDAEGKAKITLALTPPEIIQRFGITAPDDITLLLMGSIDHAGGG